MPAAHVDVVILLRVQPAAAHGTVALDSLELFSVDLLQRFLVVDGGRVEVEGRDAVEHLLAVGLRTRDRSSAVARDPRLDGVPLFGQQDVGVDGDEVSRKILK